MTPPLCLSVQFWPLYSICHQQCVIVAEVWDGRNIKVSFRRIFSPPMMESYYCLEQIDQLLASSVDAHNHFRKKKNDIKLRLLQPPKNVRILKLQWKIKLHQKVGHS